MSVLCAQQRAARLFFALGLTAALGALAHYLSNDDVTARGIKCATATAGIIIVVAQTPLVGGQPRALLENSLGTLLGASLGVAVFSLWGKLVPYQYDTDYYLRLLTAPMVGAVGLLLGQQLGMEGAGKLVAMTYLLVVVNNVEEGPAESYALYRFLGIVVGMAMAQGTATLVFQRSATEDVLDRVRGGLAELAELNRLVWGSHRGLQQQDGGGGPRPTEEQQLEAFQTRLNAQLNGALHSLPLTASECRLKRGPPPGWCFLPWPWLGLAGWRGCGGGWRLDRDLVQHTVWAIRRVNRLQCSLRLLLNHPLSDPALRHDPALNQLLKDFRFLTQAVVYGALAAATHLRHADTDALAHLQSKIMSSAAVTLVSSSNSNSNSNRTKGSTEAAAGGAAGAVPPPLPPARGAPSSSSSSLASAALASVASAVRAGAGGGSASSVAASSSDKAAATAPVAGGGGDLTEPLLPTQEQKAAKASGSSVVVTVVGGPGALEEEDGKEDGRRNDASSVFHRPQLQVLPGGLAAFESSVLTPEVWWHSFQFLLTQLAAEAGSMQEAVSQLVRHVQA